MLRLFYLFTTPPESLSFYLCFRCNPQPLDCLQQQQKLCIIHFLEINVFEFEYFCCVFGRKTFLRDYLFFWKNKSFLRLQKNSRIHRKPTHIFKLEF